jgi:DNA (cytosine-5)-methyltransferase 1
MLRVIQEAKPTWIIGENVAGIVNMALDQVCADLEGQGYEVEPIIVPACAVDAPHRRDRVWILANATNGGLQIRKNGGVFQCGQRKTFTEECKQTSNAQGSCSLANAISQRGCSGNSEGEYAEDVGKSSRHSRDNSRGMATWLPEPNVGRVAHGVPNRVAKLRGLGNAIVPQVAAEIIRCINKVMEDNK